MDEKHKLTEKLVTLGDGTQNQPRDIQKTVAAVFADWYLSTQKTLALQLPTGSGKSYIARNLQLTFPGSHIIVPSNSLLTETYALRYPEANVVKGREHYACKEIEGLSCADADALIDTKHPECESTRSFTRAMDGESTIFNPISYYYYLLKASLQGLQLPEPPLLIVDEAHKLASTLALLTDIKLSKTKYKFPNNLEPAQVVAWVGDRIEDLKDAKPKTKEDKIKIFSQIERLKNIRTGLEESPHLFAIYVEDEILLSGKKETYLKIRPAEMRPGLLSFYFKNTRTVLMSGTLTRKTLWELGKSEHNTKLYESASIIPKELRKIKYVPAESQFSYKTDPNVVADYIKHIISLHPDENTLVHVSYAWAKKLKDFFPDAIINNSANKDECIQQFKTQGGMFIAAGCAEGVDFPDDLCRVIIIPIIMKLNPVDPFVKKQRALPYGDLKQNLGILETVIQQCGRGSRHEQDWSISYIGDRMFSSMVLRCRQFLPKSFLESVEWRPQQ